MATTDMKLAGLESGATVEIVSRDQRVGSLSDQENARLDELKSEGQWLYIQAGLEIFEGWWPEAIFDLDTGQHIELHISSPVVTKSEDQGCMVNVLNPEERAEMHRYRAKKERTDV